MLTALGRSSDSLPGPCVLSLPPGWCSPGVCERGGSYHWGQHQLHMGTPLPSAPELSSSRSAAQSTHIVHRTEGKLWDKQPRDGWTRTEGAADSEHVSSWQQGGLFPLLKNNR